MNDINLILQLLPCLPQCKDHVFFIGTKNLIDNHCNKCEYLNNLLPFMEQHYPSYSLLKCCDIEEREKSQPEAIFINKKDQNRKIAIEVKSLHQVRANNKKDDDFIRKRENRFEKNFVNNICENAIKNLEVTLKENNLYDQNEIIKLLFYGTMICFTCIQHNASKNVNIKEQIIKLSKKAECELLQQLSKITKDYFSLKVKAFLQFDKDSINAVWKYDLDNFNIEVTIGKSSHDSFFSVQWFDGNPYSEWYVNKNNLTRKIQEYFDECQEKFLEFNDYKTILLLKNESRYFKNGLIDDLHNISIPPYIDEFWCSFYEYEEIWNDKLEDFDGEEIVGIKYVKINGNENS